MTLGSRYWASLTGRAAMPAPRQRGRDGYSFGRRYLAALLGITLPPRTAVTPPPGTVASQGVAAQRVTPRPAPRPAADRRSRMVRRTWALSGAMAVVLAFMVSMVVFSTPEVSQPVGSGSTASHPPLSGTELPGTEDEANGSLPNGLPPMPILFALGDTNEVARCELLTGSGTLYPQGVVVLLVFRTLDGSVRFGNVLRLTGDRWSARVEIGTEEDTGRQFTLAIYSVPPEVADKWAAQVDVPVAEVPDQPLAAATVIRNNDSAPC